jgi:serine/threonine protein kinase
MPVRLARGQRVGERYRLERELGRGSGSVTWEATDERLDRPVAVRIFDSGTDPNALMKRAGLAASLTHPRVVRVFDTGHDGGRFFTVSELLPASLRSVRLPLAPDQAIATAIDVTEALRYAHERGVVHGHIHEGNVLLSESGAKMGDFALASTGDRSDRLADLKDLGGVLRRAAGTRGTQPSGGLDRVVEGLASGAYEDAASALDALRELRPPEVRRVPRPPRRGWLIAAVVTLLVGVAAFGATRLGERSPQTRFAPGGRIDGVPVPISSVIDFDPLGDGREGSRTIAKIADDDPGTYWSTERYAAGPNFSGLKAGVGALFDLGKTTDVGKAQILFSAPGCSFELRFSEDRSAPVGNWTTAAMVSQSPASAPILFDAHRARYWLIWITGLTTDSPGAGRSYACAVAEADLFTP